MKKLILLHCFFISHLALAQIYGDFVVDKVNSVYDGDTFRADVKGLDPISGDNIPVRLYGIDTPEIKGKCELEKKLAIRARDFLKSKLLAAKKIEVHNVRRDKYFRLLATVYIDGTNVADLLLAEQLARPYIIGKRHNWCE